MVNNSLNIYKGSVLILVKPNFAIVKFKDKGGHECLKLNDSVWDGKKIVVKLQKPQSGFYLPLSQD